MRRLAAVAVLLIAAGGGLVTHPAEAEDRDIHFNGAFSPNPQTAIVGDYVFWCNDTDQSITVAVEGDPIGSIAADDCSDGFRMADDDIGPYNYVCTSCIDPKPAGVLHVQAAPTTTTPPVTAAPMPPAPPPPPPAAPPTTRRSTATTRRAATTTTVSSTTTSELTTTTFFTFDTSTTGFTTTTGDLAINESSDGGGGLAPFVLGSIGVVVLGGGYALWRYRRGDLP